jgi:hypothetical protein
MFSLPVHKRKREPGDPAPLVAGPPFSVEHTGTTPAKFGAGKPAHRAPHIRRDGIRFGVTLVHDQMRSNRKPS